MCRPTDGQLKVQPRKSTTGVGGIAGIPMRLDDQIIGALNLYSAGPREWSERDVGVAEVLADVATSYVVNASKLRQQEQLSEQLQQALESRVVIEQAKGITAQQNSVRIDQAYQLMRGHARSNNARALTHLGDSVSAQLVAFARLGGAGQSGLAADRAIVESKASPLEPSPRPTMTRRVIQRM
jgi:GAF domain-containing protein